MSGTADNGLFCQIKLTGPPQMNSIAAGLKMRLRQIIRRTPDNAVKFIRFLNNRQGVAVILRQQADRYRVFTFCLIGFQVIAQPDDFGISESNADLFLNFADSTGLKCFTGINMSPKMDQ